VPAVSVRRAEVVYRGLSGPVAALGGLDLELADGEPVAVIGPSGCGKSTLLLALAGLVKLTAGNISVGGKAVDEPRLRSALILQDFGLLPWKTVARNVALGLEIRGVARTDQERHVQQALERVGLASFASAFPGELSGGMRQRVAVARALALEADLLLMDEPLSALDALTREDLQGLLLEIWRQRRHTSVLVTHSIDEAVFLGRRIVVLTERPARVASILPNPAMGDPEYRNAPEFYRCCAEVRRLLTGGELQQ